MAGLKIDIKYGNAMVWCLAKMDTDEIVREGGCVEALRQIKAEAIEAVKKDIRAASVCRECEEVTA